MKPIVSFDGLVIRKEFFLDYSYHMEAHIDMVVAILEVQSSVSIQFCFDEKLI